MILVAGAAGNGGRDVLSQLLRTGATGRVFGRVLAHNPEVAGLPGDANVVCGDLSVPATLAA